MKKVLSVVFNELKNDNRVFNQAFSLSSAGYDVTLLGIQRKTSLPDKVYLNGVKIIRKRIKNKTIIQIKYIRYLYFMLYLWIHFFRQARNSYDVVHCHDLNTLQYGAFMKLVKWGKLKLIYDAHEYETQRNGLQGYRQKYIKLKERFLIRFCDRVITVSDSIADEYVRLYGIEKPVVILNCPILRSEEVLKKDLFRKEFGISADKKIFLYQGYFSYGRGIEVLLEAFDQLNLADCVLIFLGKGALADKIRKHDKYGKSIFIHPFVSGDVLLEYTSSADFGISFIEDICLSYRYCLPNKMFEYIAAGLPIITSGLPEMQTFVNTNKVGVSVKKNTVDGLIKAVEDLLYMDSCDLQENIENARRKFNWEMEERKLLNIYSHDFKFK